MINPDWEDEFINFMVIIIYIGITVFVIFGILIE